MNLTNKPEIKKGQVYWADFPSGFDHLHEGMRPAVILSNDQANKGAATVLVCPCTTSTKKPLPVHVSLGGGSTALLEEIVVIDKTRLKSLIGELDWRTMREINIALMIEFGLV